MNSDRAQLIQDLAKIEVADVLMARLEMDTETNFAKRCSIGRRQDAAQNAWCQRVNAAEFTEDESRELQRVRALYHKLIY